jgi:outer membrane receptor for ferrienterochelin and colicin
MKSYQIESKHKVFRMFTFLPSARRWRSARPLLCSMLASLLGPSAALAASANDPVDLAQLPIEQLLNLEVFSASKFVQKISEAPAAVSVVTADEIKTFGWRTLADILRSLPGLYVSNDRNYSYLGSRGFLRPGDYNTRFLLLVDGYRTNDSVYDQASIGTEFVLDVDLIDRVEFVPGPGSSIYGPNAFFGVINVISKRGRDLNGAQVSIEAGSFGASKGRASYGWRGANGAELLLSATGFNVNGQNLYFPEFDSPATNHGVAQGLDYDRGQSFFAKASLGAAAFTLAHSERKKGIPTASFGQVFNDPRSHTFDTQTLADFGYRRTIADNTELSAHAFWGRYDYQGDYIFDQPPVTVNRDGSYARWWGGDVKLVSTGFERHKLVAGAEMQRDYRRDQYNFNVAPVESLARMAPGVGAIGDQSILDDRRQAERFGAYVQDEITLRENLLVNAGLRYDHNSTTGGAFNPRLALIYKPTQATTVKALYGTAFRAPNAYELFYQTLVEGGQKANPDLRPERTRSRELVLEHSLTADSRITALVFHNDVSDLITQTIDPNDGLLIYKNLSRAVTSGIGLEFERSWAGGTKIRTSYNWQHAVDSATDTILANSPAHLAKLNLSAPVFSGIWRSGLEAQYVGARNTLQSRIGGYWLANITLSSARLAKGMEVSAGLYNLLDRRYADPGSEEHVQDAIQQDGRSLRLKLVYNF